MTIRIWQKFFSELKGITIKHFIINYLIEKVKAFLFMMNFTFPK